MHNLVEFSSNLEACSLARLVISPARWQNVNCPIPLKLKGACPESDVMGSTFSLRGGCQRKQKSRMVSVERTARSVQEAASFGRQT
jgi:hypothetical protein